MAVGNKESANFFRLIKVIVDVGSEVMRDVIRQKVLPDTLGNVVQTNIAKIDRLKKENILFNEQYNLLTQVPPDPEKFDISLLRIILRNICPNVPAPMHGWDKDPDPTDFSLGADILRLQKFRNTISAHTPNTRMTDVDFENTWLDVRTVIVRVSNHGSLQNVAGRIDAVKTEHLDPLSSQMQKLLKVFCDWQKQNEMDQTILEKLEKQDHKLDKVLERVGVNNDSDVGYEETSYTDRNPLDDNLDLFAEELEVCDELIQLLKVKELIPSNTEETLRKTKSRASEIRCLLKLISSPETGYAAIKEYLVDANKYLHKQLLEREEKLPTRELFFQCKVQYRRSVSEQRSHLEKSDIQNPEYYWDLIEPICFFKKELLGCWTEMEHDDPLIKDAPITQEHLNHMRLCHALVTVCADALRDILLNQIPPGYPDFYQLLLARKAALQGMRQFRPEQIGILYPDPQNLKTGTVDQFDITLLYALIRFVSAVVPPGTGWGRPPDDNPRDTSLGASVERMRLLRNTVVGKSVDNKVDEQTFENTWDAITQITDDIENVIGDKGYKAALRERKNQTITLGRRTKNAEEI